jgi:hypothetical protein
MPVIKISLHFCLLFSHDPDNEVKDALESAVIARVHATARILARIEARQIKQWIPFWMN